MEEKGYVIPEDLLYTREHEWIRLEGRTKGTVGITDYAVKALHEIVYVDLPAVGSEVRHMQPFGSVESVKAVSDLYSPLTGKIEQVNDKLRTNPELVMQSPYGEGWIITMTVAKPDEETKTLLSSLEYAELIKQLMQK